MKNVLATAVAAGIVAWTLLPAFAGEGCAMGKGECTGQSMACNGSGNGKEKAQSGNPASSTSANSDKKDAAVATVGAEKGATAGTSENKEEAKTK